MVPKMISFSKSNDNIIEDPAKSVKEYYEKIPFTKECFKSRCKENNVKVKGATSKSYLIL